MLKSASRLHPIVIALFFKALLVCLHQCRCFNELERMQRDPSEPSIRVLWFGDSRPTSKRCSALGIAVWILEATESAAFRTQQIGVAQNSRNTIMSMSRSTVSLDTLQFSSSTTLFVMSPLKYRQASSTVHYFKLRNKPNNIRFMVPCINYHY